MNKQLRTMGLLSLGLLQLALVSSPLLAQALAVRGRILDSKGEAVIGASIQVKGSPGKGAVSNVKGEFALTGLKPGTILRISCIGMQPQEVSLSGRNQVTITLQDAATKIDEVVVVGYGVQRKVNLTGAVSSVKGTALARRPVGDASQSLQGLVPGLLVTNGSAGRPGGTGKLSLRGQGNLKGDASPYILVDGVEMSLSEVNPNDIESISVLKDAAASAIYGARAAYGVILVTTKQGKEGRIRIGYQANLGWTSPTLLPRMANALEFAHYWNAGVSNAGSPRRYSPEKIALLERYMADPSSVDVWAELPKGSLMNPAFENSEQGVGNVDYFALHYKPWARKQSHNLSVSGGNKDTQYYVSGGSYSEDGILRYAQMKYQRYNFASRLSSRLLPWLRLKLDTKYVHTQNDTPFGGGGLAEGFYHSLARFRPTVSVTDPHGHFTELSMVPYLQSGTYTQEKRDKLNLTAGVELQPLKDWRINLDYSYRLGGTEYEALNRAPKIYAADGERTSLGVRSELGVLPQGKFTRSFGKELYRGINLYSNYMLSLGDKHHFTFLLGYQEEESHTSYLEHSVTGLYSLDNPNAAVGSGDKVPVDQRYGWATRGFFGRINYDYDGRYLLEVNGRYDGSSRFAAAHRWGFFPSASLGWNIHRERFMQRLSPTLSTLKLRASYGLLGNQAGAALYTFASTMNITRGLGSYIYQDGRHPYTLAPKVIDPNTTWEQVSSLNLGLDFGLWHQALTGSLEVFERTTRDMLGPGLPLPELFGAAAPETNNAELRNRGWELSLNWHGRIGREVDYSLGAQLSDATAVVTRYTSVDKSSPQSQWYEGRSPGEIWGFRSDGLIQTQAEADAYNKEYNLSYLSGQPWTPGDVKYRDLNGDYRIDVGKSKLGDMGDMTIIGDTTPRYQFTLNGSIAWRGLSLSWLLQGVGKRDWHPGSGSIYFWGWGPYAQVTVFKEHLDYWTPEHPDAYYPKPYIHTAGGVGPYQRKNKTTTDRYLQNAAYMRLKNLTLSYELPQHWTKWCKLQVYLSGENLWTLTGLKSMFDPEAIFTGSSYTSEGGKNYPMNRVLSCGVVVNL